MTLKQRWARWRDTIRDRRAADIGYRLVVGVVGAAILGVGVLAIPYPGPGWAIVFIGLGILATEFLWAQRVLKFSKHRYDKSMAWFRGQGLWVQAVGIVFTTAVVVATLWVAGAIGWAANLVGVE
ncbi:MAG: TIGR02611 family protein, partial [Mycobacterium sp.]